MPPQPQTNRMGASKRIAADDLVIAGSLKTWCWNRRCKTGGSGREWSIDTIDLITRRWRAQSSKRLGCNRLFQKCNMSVAEDSQATARVKAKRFVIRTTVV